MSGHPIRFTTAGSLIHTPELWHWLPGLALGALLFWLSKRVKNQFFIPAMLPIGIGLFYIAIWLGGVSVTDARAHGWLPSFPTGGSLQFVPLATVLKGFSVVLLVSNLSVVATILVTSVVSILLTATALELSVEKDIDLNRELRAAGAASFLSGLAGGMVGFHSLSMSRLAISMGARSRWVGIVAAL